MDKFLAIYNEISGEFYNDLKRRLDIQQYAVSDPYATAAVINDFVLGELAQLRAQILDIDLRVSQIVGQPRTAALLAAGRSLTMPKVYGAGDSIHMGDPIATYGFHMLEGRETPFRWSGPTANCGLIAHIERVRPLAAVVRIMARITSQIAIVAVRVDGVPVPFIWTDEPSLRFEISPVPQNDDLLFTPTLLTFTCNEVVCPSELDPLSADNRTLGIGIIRVDLAPASLPRDDGKNFG
jgi:hypothetical protein